MHIRLLGVFKFSLTSWDSFKLTDLCFFQKPGCFANRGIIEHELLHVVGLLHEQARPDRDEHVVIHWENIDKTYYQDFAKGRTRDVTTFDLPYDYKSIMHYPSWAFSKNGKSTITAKVPETHQSHAIRTIASISCCDKCTIEL